MTQQERIVQEQSAIRLKPIVSYPREATVGERYLFTIDVQLAEDSPWPYQEEEFEISFILETTPFFTHEPLGEHEPGIVLHRYGGTYGAAEYLLTASKKIVAPGKIKVTLLNGWGLPIAQVELECEVKKDVRIEGKRTKRNIKQEQKPSQPSTHLEKINVKREEALLRNYEPRVLTAIHLSLVGWNVQSADELRQGSTIPRIAIPSGNIALQGYQSMESDFLLFIEHELVGLVKVHPIETQLTNDMDAFILRSLIESGISKVKFQNFRDISGQLQAGLPFVYHTTSYETTFRNYLEPGIHNRNIYTFHRPSTLAAWLGEARRNPSYLLHARLLRMPALEQGDLFDYQYEALQRVEQSLAAGHSRTLIQLETGGGKTHIATRSIHRLLEYAHVRHIFYVVDIDLAKQYASDAFKNYIIDKSSLFEETPFTDRYGVEIISNEKLDASVHVYIGTLEDLYTLYASGGEGEHLPAPIRNNASVKTLSSIKDYCADLPIEYFDAIFLAESEHIDYPFWRPVLDYFDTFYIGIASHVSDETLRFFNTHLVYPSEEVTEEPQGQGSASSLSPQELVALMTDVRRLLSSDADRYHDTDHLLQLVWLLFLKYIGDFELTQEKLIGVNYIPIIAPGYRWRDWVVTGSSHQQRTSAELLNFVNDDLFPYLGRLNGENARDIRSIISVIFRGTHNSIISGYILRRIVDMLNTINFNSSDDMRIIVLYYETMLKEMCDSASDSSDFYTPRPIVRFIIDCLNPQLGESLLDPACGTAGFLVETYERLVGQVHTSEQRQQLQDDLIGIEKKPMAYLLGIMNLLLHGIEVPNIIQSNALVTNIQQLQDEDYVDIIATTPTFGGKEGPNVVSNFPQDMRTGETSLLFVQYIMQALKRPGGRCGIVLPDSFLFGTGVASEIKRYLLISFNLHTIVRLPRGTFAPYTSIPTNILFFEASEYLNSLGGGSCTKEVWYYEISLPNGQRSYTKTKPIQYEAFHDCLLWWNHREENEHAWKVPVEVLFANDCNLDVKKPVHSFSYPKQEFERIENPFAAYARGHIVENSQLFYGRSQLIKRMTESIDGTRSQYSNIILYGQKRAGKSSILHHLQKILARKDDLLILAPTLVLSLDETTPFIYQILWLILSSLKWSIEDEIENKKRSQLSLVLPTALEFFQQPSPLFSFIEIFRAFKLEAAKNSDWQNLRILLIIDEFQQIYNYIMQGKLSGNFMKDWKTIIQSGFFSTVLAGQDVMIQFIQQFPNELGGIQVERVGYLEREDAEKLIDEPIRIGGKNGETRYREGAIARILDLTAGSPFYIQVICSHLVDYMNRYCIKYVTEADVDQVKNELITGNNSLEFYDFDNLIDSGDTSNNAISSSDILNVLKIIASNNKNNASCNKNMINCETQAPLDTILDDLITREVIKRVSSDNYVACVGLFKEWLIANQ